VAYPVKDVKAARSFYEGALGLVETANWQDQWVEYDIGSGTLALMKADEQHKPGQYGPSVGIEVNDFDKTLEHLKAHSIPLDGQPYDTPVCRGCFVRDPDGNKLILHSRKQQPGT